MSLNDSLRSLVYRSLRLGFRLTPMPAVARDRLRQRFVDRHGHLVPRGPVGKPTTTTVIQARDHSAQRLLTFVPRRHETLPASMPATIVAFYLPQFHPIPENDAWWGPGFTEWRNVGRALPQFEGHAQPRLPGDLGYYDLRLPEVMRQQIAMAREYGVGAFCTYFYWFAGKTLLETPLRQWLTDASLDLPICLCWANENWSRRWDGRADDVLIGQAHSADDDLAFIKHVSVYLRDPRYLRVAGKPMLLVYRPGLLPEPRATARRWREWCRLQGVGEIHLAYVQSFDNVDPASIGFDAAVAFPPNNISLEPVTAEYRLINPAFAGQIYDWRALAAAAMAAGDPPYRLYPTVNPGWDNEARRSGRGRSFLRATPRAFTDWTRAAITKARRRAPDAPMVFVNAWNEWAEGAILEPDAHYGYAWLDALRKALCPAVPIRTRPCAVIHVEHPERLEGVVSTLRATGLGFRTILSVPSEHEDTVRTVASRLAVDTEIVVSTNRGKDVLPFLRIAGRLLDEGEDVVLKLHIARSNACPPGLLSRDEALDALISPPRANAVAGAFARDATLGLVLPDEYIPSSVVPGQDAAYVDYLCALLGIVAGRIEDTAVTGTMFWCRLRALAPVIDAPLSETDFPLDVGCESENITSAVERVVALTVTSGGFRVVPARQVVNSI